MHEIQKLNHELIIVIPTAGRNSLVSTLHSISNSSMIPMEVIISLPPGITMDLDTDLFQFKVTRMNAQKKGQVRQRFEGIMAAKSNYILQMDDDIELQQDCIEKLYEGCKRFPKNAAFSPKILEKKTSLSFFEYNNLHFNNEYNKLCNPTNIGRKIFNLVIHGKTKFLPGEVTKLGSNIQAYSNSTRYIPVDWLHGMLMQHKENFLDFEHLPFPGKAYAEDCIFSSYLKASNINLYVDNDAIITAEIDQAKAIRTIKEIRFFLEQQYSAIRNKAYYCYVSNRRYKTFIFYAVMKFIIFIILRIISKIKTVFRKI